MNRRTKLITYALTLCLPAASATAALAQSNPQSNPQSKAAAQTAAAQPSTPAQVVRAYYVALKEARVLDAIMLSILRPAVEALSPEELKELQPDFARLSASAPADFEITGEQLSGDEATVFVRTGDGRDLKVDPVNLIRERGAWVIGDREGAAEVKKQGRKFFFEQRIATHEGEAEDMLKRIQAAELAYSLQHGGSFAALDKLVAAGYVPQDILGTETTGYRFTVTVTEGSKSFEARAEPARYGRTGRLSFIMEKGGIRKKDSGGKPLSSSK